MRTRNVCLSAFMGLIVMAGLAGCATPSATSPGSSGSGPSGGHGTRSELYSSLSGLADDSSQIVAGTVTKQKLVSDLIPDSFYTISTVETTEVLASDGSITPGQTVEVRQIGDSGHVGPAPLLVDGSSYLLYLTHSGLEGDLASQYYVTGGSAGIYAAVEPSAQARGSEVAPVFERLSDDEGDVLPTEVSIDQAQG